MNQVEKDTPIPCHMCNQPVTEDYRFTLSWSEDGEEVSRVFCGPSCLKQWVDENSDSVKLDLFDPTGDEFIFNNVSAANLRTCNKCGKVYAGTLVECPVCGEKVFAGNSTE